MTVPAAQETTTYEDVLDLGRTRQNGFLKFII